MEEPRPVGEQGLGVMSKKAGWSGQHTKEAPGPSPAVSLKCPEPGDWLVRKLKKKKF